MNNGTWISHKILLLLLFCNDFVLQENFSIANIVTLRVTISLNFFSTPVFSRPRFLKGFHPPIIDQPLQQNSLATPPLQTKFLNGIFFFWFILKLKEK